MEDLNFGTMVEVHAPRHGEDPKQAMLVDDGMAVQGGGTRYDAVFFLAGKLVMAHVYLDEITGIEGHAEPAGASQVMADYWAQWPGGAP